MAVLPMREVVEVHEMRGRVRFPYGVQNAAMMLVCRLFTDAVFNADIRAIQLIVDRIDGGLPRDDEMGRYQTMFGDCLREVMAAEHGDQLKVKPDDSVMLTLCKSLYSIAVEDIYVDGDGRPRKPTDAQKRDRDAAMRMVLERTGGRRTKAMLVEEAEDVEVASWIAELPGVDDAAADVV